MSLPIAQAQDMDKSVRRALRSIDELAEKLDNTQKREVVKDLQREQSKALKPFANAARSIVPKDSGNLRKSIRARRKGRRYTIFRYGMTVSRDLEHTAPIPPVRFQQVLAVEYGLRKKRNMVATKVFSKAWNSVKGGVQNEFYKGITKVVNRAAEKVGRKNLRQNGIAR